MGLQWHLRFEFVTGLAGQLYTNESNGDGNFVHYHGKSACTVDSFDCVIPIRIYGIRTAVRKGKTMQFEVL